MSEHMNTRTTRGYRRKLLATVSAIALMASICGAEQAKAAGGDAGHPVLWIEGGWHFERTTGRGDSYSPHFASVLPSDFTPLSVAQSMKLTSYGADGKIAFQPDGSDWLLSASVSYGRTHGRRHTHEEPPVHLTFAHSTPFLGRPAGYVIVSNPGGSHDLARVMDVAASDSENHAVVDFRAGKDVSLGMLGREGESIVSAGIRFAQFSSANSPNINLVPSIDLQQAPPKYFPNYHHATYFASPRIHHNFHGIGPAISWDASATLAGNSADGAITLDWGVNASVLFGRQKTMVHHKTVAYDEGKYRTTLYRRTNDIVRERTVTVPNAGGFAGLSFRYADAKLSVGYRADFFFGAIDGGVETRHSTTTGFFGPFASIAIGVGD